MEAQLGHMGTEGVAVSLLPALEKQSRDFSYPVSPVCPRHFAGYWKGLRLELFKQA